MAKEVDFLTPLLENLRFTNGLSRVEIPCNDRYQNKTIMEMIFESPVYEPSRVRSFILDTCSLFSRHLS